MNMHENAMEYIHLTGDRLLGSYTWEGGLNLLNIVLIGLSDKLPEHSKQYELHRLLGTLLSIDLSIKEKLNIIETEYLIPNRDDIKTEVNIMCNLSQGILERGIEEGKRKIILNMYKKGYTLEQIAGIAETSVDAIENIVKNNDTVLA